MWGRLLTGCGLPLEAWRSTKARHIQLHRSSQMCTRQPATERTNRSSPTVLQGREDRSGFHDHRQLRGHLSKGCYLHLHPVCTQLSVPGSAKQYLQYRSSNTRASVLQYSAICMMRCIPASCIKHIGNLSVGSLWTLFDTGSLSISKSFKLCFNERLWHLLWCVWFRVFLYLSWAKIYRRWNDNKKKAR